MRNEMDEQLTKLNEIITETEVRIAARKRLFKKIDVTNPIAETFQCSHLMNADKELLKTLKRTRKKVIKDIAKKIKDEDMDA